MNLDPTVKKFIQVSEAAQTPIYVPVQVGNERFIAIQQDLRKIEDVRLLGFYKLMPNGELKTLDSCTYDILAFHLQSLIEASRKTQEMLYENRQNAVFSGFNSTILCHQNCQTTEPIHISSPISVATLTQQMEWERCRSSCLDACTSSTELERRNQQNVQTCCSVCCCTNCRDLRRKLSTRKVRVSTGINTEEEFRSIVTNSEANNTQEDCEKQTQTQTQTPDSNLSAREQLKQKRLNQEKLSS